MPLSPDLCTSALTPVGGEGALRAHSARPLGRPAAPSYTPHGKAGARMTPDRFAKGMTFDDYLKFIGSPQNLAREGFDIRRFALCKPRVDWSGYLRERLARARLSDEQTTAIKWLAAQPGGPAKVAVIAEDW